MYRTEIFVKMTTLAELEKNCCDREKFEGFCRECRNYNTVWSCPPYNFSPADYVKEYNYIYVVGVKLIFDEETLNTINTCEKINDYTAKTLYEMKNRIMIGMLELEKIYPQSQALSAGGCKICEDCSRKSNIQCQHPELMRYSLESMGFDVGAISTTLLNFELKWATATRLPDYFSLVTGLMTKEKVENFEENIKKFL